MSTSSKQLEADIAGYTAAAAARRKIINELEEEIKTDTRLIFAARCRLAGIMIHEEPVE